MISEIKRDFINWRGGHTPRNTQSMSLDASHRKEQKCIWFRGWVGTVFEI